MHKYIIHIYIYIIKIIKYLKVLQHVSDHKGSIIRELYTLLGYNYSNGSIVSVDMDLVAAYSDCGGCVCVVHRIVLIISTDYIFAHLLDNRCLY